MAIIVSGDWWRLEDDGTLYIYCAGDMPIGEDADSPWIDYYEYIRSVVIQDSVTNIAWGAFSGFESLSSVTIGNGVTSIGRQAFAFCVTLHDIIIPANVTSIGEEAFAYCAALESVSIPYRITSIEQYTFDSCSGLTSVIIPNGVTSIGDAAFSNCDNLSDVYYGGTELQWDDIYVGGYNSALWNAEIHYNYSPSVTIYTVTFDANGGTGTMSAQTFDAGTAQALTPNAFTRTGYTFGGWNTAADGSGTDYADGASYTASADVTLYAQWIQIVLTSIAVTTPPTKTAYTVGETFNPAGMVVTATYSDNTTATVSGYSTSPSGALTVADTVITVSYTEGNITETATVAVTVTESWWRIENGDTLRISCVGDMPDYETSYGRPPPWYDYREQITSAVIENSVTSIGGSAFEDFANLTSVTIPSGITSIGQNAFYDCTALSSVAIPGSVTSIGGNAFRGCTSLTTVTIPDSVTSIGNCAFTDSGLTNVTIPGSATSIPFLAFSECPLSSATIQSGVTSIGKSAFYKCNSLTSITIPASVTQIKEYAFADCSRLSSVYYGGTQSQWNAITIGGDNTPLTSATIHYTEPAPGSVTLSGIAVTNPPTKTAYMAGETFSRTGMVVTASYSDGTTATVSGYSVSPSGALTISNTSVTISYTEGGITKTATVAITVTESEPIPGTVVLSGIAITTPPAKTTYTAGEIFSTAGMIVTAAYSDGTTATVTNYSVFPSGALTASDTIITVSYTEDGVTKAATVAITVTGETPEPTPAVIGRITYTGQSKPIRRLCEAVNALYARTPRLFIDGDAYISMDYGGDGA